MEEHVSKADPDIGEDDEDGAAKEVDQHQVEATLSKLNNSLMLNLWRSVLYLCVGGGGIGSDDDKDWTEKEAGSQGGPRAAL